ncbi:hypothetical protein [Gottfriedia solisilvae]|uniref:Uncharacterized protein n=1 Tax=Gottfriedia solisilvae TaxID=1516104 RepID=A0A8J3F1T7_9BACI|nr:hypothetical protein [Gottfriedia solisilvae]GGI13701.1 hypothetical protein GCM10007380_19230 [Gottfriedia solisilvae]
MDFKKEFILKTKEIYKETVSENHAYSKLCNKFESYFTDLKESLKKEIEAANGELDILIDEYAYTKVVFFNRELEIKIDEPLIEVLVKYYDEITNENIEKTIDIIEYKDGVYNSQVFQSSITRNIIDNYLAVAFREDLEKNVSKKEY